MNDFSRWLERLAHKTSEDIPPYHSVKGRVLSAIEEKESADDYSLAIVGWGSFGTAVLTIGYVFPIMSLLFDPVDSAIIGSIAVYLGAF